MQPILILTKNLLVDQTLQNNLQQLGYEVFCTSELLKRVQYSSNGLDFLHLYPLIILSGTLSNQEIQEIIPRLNNGNSVIFRKLIQSPSLEEKEQLKQLGVDDWFNETSSLDSIREMLSLHFTQKKDEQNNQISLYYLEDREQRLHSFEEKLSRKERQVYRCLMESETNVVSRIQLCQYIWGDSPTNSHLSQLSFLIQKVKTKLQTSGIEDIQVETLWGQGYKMHTVLDKRQLISN